MVYSLIAGQSLPHDWIPNGVEDVELTPEEKKAYQQPWVSNHHLPIPGGNGRHHLRDITKQLNERTVREGIIVHLKAMQNRPVSLQHPLPTSLLVPDAFLFSLYKNCLKGGRPEYVPTGHEPLPLTDSPAGEFSLGHGWRSLSTSPFTCCTTALPKPMTIQFVMGMDNILVPLTNSVHHMLFHIQPRLRLVRLLDSGRRFGSDERLPALKMLVRFFSELESKLPMPQNQQTGSSAWRGEDDPFGIPQQPTGDSESCGVFVIMFALQILYGHNACNLVRKKHIKSCRIKLFNEFVSATLS